MSEPLAPTSSVPVQRPLRATHRGTGATVMLVPSQSVAGKWHVVGADRCDCIGFQARGRCCHLEVARAELAAPAIPDCGICGQVHRCHSPHLQSWCSRCVPLVRVPLVGRLLA